MTLLLGFPLAEIALFIVAGELVGLWPTLAATLLAALAGAALIRRQGVAAMRRLQASAAIEPVPAAAAFDGAALVAAGILLITPGFLTDAIALLLLLPATRLLLRRRAWGYLRSHVRVATPAGDPTIIDGEAVVVSETDRPPPPSLR
ncbi:MAG: FxsA family protein [Alphaproteobacteria bacterium]|nr:FxsA family protein [Alphaproteobacteria bacterium]